VLPVTCFSPSVSSLVSLMVAGGRRRRIGLKANVLIGL
jgi:hypothetical protein